MCLAMLMRHVVEMGSFHALCVSWAGLCCAWDCCGQMFPGRLQTCMFSVPCNVEGSKCRRKGKRKAGSTRRSSQAVPHPSTNRALRRLTSEVGRDPVHSTRYGRQRHLRIKKNPKTNFNQCLESVEHEPSGGGSGAGFAARARRTQAPRAPSAFPEAQDRSYFI